MTWSQSAPTMVDGYVELDGGEIVVSGSAPASPLVVEFQMDPMDSLEGDVYFGGTGAAANLEVAITLEMFTSETAPPMASA